jgi:hypothetical protein
MRRIVFLDVDGVLNVPTTGYDAYAEGINIEPAKLPLLKYLVDFTNAEIVLSSSWRSHRSSCEDIGQVLGDYGMVYRNCTPDYKGATIRGEEISAWLSIQNERENIRYVILDDYPPLHFCGHEKHLVTVDPQKGLTESDVDKAVKILCPVQYQSLSPVCPYGV